MDLELAYSLAGFAVGFIVGMTGIGGGSLMTPILVLGFGVQPAVAVGTDLLYAAITKAGGIFVHNSKGTVDWRIVGLLTAGSVPTSIAMVFVLKWLEARGIHYGSLITTTLSVALILTALAMLFKERVHRFAEDDDRFDLLRQLHQRYLPHITILTGVLLGVLVTLSSVGAGAIGTAALFFLYPRMTSIRIIGTDLAHAVPLTAVAGIGHAAIGTVDYSMLLSLLLGSLPGIYLGSHLATRLPEKIVRPALAAMLLIIGVRLAF
ncbi:putative membrane protein YfcA [Methylohalomonas lacus]|uniref:Probable membrane transporter protein n=1 Tax=Methylohalomonas lacus TaxID=398773 RepID=A0AAE3HJT5_9GAMM|nr:sulfite exporter TauE/SafE family protein [Methylohalomonas lacus]MCS3903664.1 putative membrane protein YfcA [Methylohalomonas lacus]